MKQKPGHAAIALLQVKHDQLLLAGQTVAEIAHELGQTPFYAYEGRAIDQRIQSLKNLFPSVSLHYAIKANPMPELVHFVAQRVDGLDVASAKELKLALASTALEKDISFAGPGKSEPELLAAVEAGVVINVESERELSRILHISQALKKRACVALRVNPDFELKSSGMKMAGGAKPFGIDAERIPELLQRMENMDVNFYGFHIFTGSQNLKSEQLCDAHQQIFNLAFELADATTMPIRKLNIGGGFGIPYFPGETALDLQPVAQNLQPLITAAHKKLGDVEIILELGRYLVGEAGVYVCEVIDKKVSRGETFVITNGGLHHHLAASGNFGQVIRKNYPVYLARQMFTGKREVVNVVGPLCTPLDILANRHETGMAEVGDLIVVMQSGAYGYSASPRDFLGHPPIQEIMLS